MQRTGADPALSACAGSWLEAGRADTPRGRTAANETRPEQARKTQKPASGKPLHIDCVFGTPENWRVRRGSANARLGHAYPWYATYSSHIPASPQAFPTKKTAPAPARARGGWRAAERGFPTRSQTKPPRADGGSPGRISPQVGGRERPTHGDRQSAPWREEDAQGALAFRNGYFSFGARFTSCPRLTTTGMVMALAGQASTQALQRVQSASVRSP